jgi:aldehyde dehydrogenase (NAD+)
MAETYKNYIDGEWIESETGDTFEVRNPADTTELVGYFQRSNGDDAERAVEAASAAQPEWADVPSPERGAILREAGKRLEDRKQEVVEALVREEGKTLSEADGEVQRTIDIFFYYASKARDYTGTVKASSSSDRNIYTIQEPVGVVAVITPWNFPNAIAAWKIVPALATGNTVVFNPASLAPNNTRHLVEVLDEAGLPDGVLNYVSGPGSEVGATFNTHDAVDAVSFTGSSNVGMHVFEQASKDQKRVQTEMGG